VSRKIGRSLERVAPIMVLLIMVKQSSNNNFMKDACLLHLIQCHSFKIPKNLINDLLVYLYIYFIPPAG